MLEKSAKDFSSEQVSGEHRGGILYVDMKSGNSHQPQSLFQFLANAKADQVRSNKYAQMQDNDNKK